MLARTSQKKVADILSTEIENIKQRYPHFELEIEQVASIVHLFLVYVRFLGKGHFSDRGRLLDS